MPIDRQRRYYYATLDQLHILFPSKFPVLQTHTYTRMAQLETLLLSHYIKPERGGILTILAMWS